MKKIITFFILIFLCQVSNAQNTKLLGRWSGVHNDQDLILVFTPSGKGIWKITAQSNSKSLECECSFTVTVQITWRIKSNIVFMELGKATGSKKVLQNNSDDTETRKFCISNCEGLLTALMEDYSDKNYSDELLFEGKNKVWMLGIEFTKVSE